MSGAAAQDVVYRPLQTCDRDRLQELHNQLFPITYEAEFFRKATLGLDSISSHAAFVHGELVAFITFRVVAYGDCEDQGLLGLDLRDAGSERAVAYILTLGTDEAHRRRGLASTLLTRALAECKARVKRNGAPAVRDADAKDAHAQAVHHCRLLYLHVITYNDAALSFYARQGFQTLRREAAFYEISQQRYDAFALGVYMNGGSAPSAASAMVSALHAAMAAGFRWLTLCTAARQPAGAVAAHERIDA